MLHVLRITLIIGLVFLIQHVQSKNILKDRYCKPELIFVQTLCRHGDRNIEYSYPNDQYQSEEFWPEGYSQMTKKGKQQLYEVGKYLRERYKMILGDGSYSADKVYVYSTDVNRVLMSAGACLAGLFPPNADQKWNEHLDWQPIPIHMSSKSEEHILDPSKQCDRYKEIFEANERIMYNALTSEYKSLVEYLRVNSGRELATIYEISKLYDTLQIEEWKNYSLPSWAKEVMGPGSDFEFLALNRFLTLTGTTELKKFVSGFLLKDILDRFTNKTKSVLSPNRSIWMYFGHESILASMLDTLGVYELHQPAYASCIFFELYRCGENSFVQIFYKNTTENKMDIPAQNIPKCGSECPLHKMYELYEDVLPKQSYEEECESPESTSDVSSQ